MCTDSMAINIVLLVLGVIIVLKGADWLTDGAVNLSLIHISEPTRLSHASRMPSSA